MLTSRVALASLRSHSRLAQTSSTALRFQSQVASKEEDEEDAISPVTQRRENMSKKHKNMVFGTTGNVVAPVLPENPAEIAKLDDAQHNHSLHADGTERTVIIRQMKASMRQSPLAHEKMWKIFFYEDGTTAHKWENSLMGWTSNADPYQCAPPLMFGNAADAVYFAKKRGWNYVVKKPIPRYLRHDDAQYQDNFLPQAVAERVQREGTSCDHWKRTSAGTSHYQRPLKYHGDGLVPQYGPNGEQATEPHVEGYFKNR